MKKQLIALGLAAAGIALAMVPAALAARPLRWTGRRQAGWRRARQDQARQPAKGKPFACKGAVVSVDATNGTLLVTVSRVAGHAPLPWPAGGPFTLGAHARVFIRTVECR